MDIHLFLLLSNPLADSYALGHFWTGLRNTNVETCQDGDCVNKLNWHSDGSVYDQHIPGHGVKMRGDDICVRYMGPDNGISDSPCETHKRTYVCQFKCPEIAGV